MSAQLPYKVEYSKDGGETWHFYRTFLTEAEATSYYTNVKTDRPARVSLNGIVTITILV